MKVGVMNNPAISLSDEINWIASNNFGFIDLTTEPPGAYGFDVNKAKREVIKSGLEIVGHTNPSLPVLFPISEIANMALKNLKDSITILSKLGASKINVHPYYYKDISETDLIGKNLLILKILSDFAKSLNAELMLENYLAPFDNPTVFTEIFREIPDLKLHLDIGHINITSSNPLLTLRQFFEEHSQKIIHIHMHDNKGEEDEHLPLGCGNINWKEAIGIIKPFYDGTITLEVFSPDREYLLISRDKLVSFWKQAGPI